MSPKQIGPYLADERQYIASESTLTVCCASTGSSSTAAGLVLRRRGRVPSRGAPPIRCGAGTSTYLKGPVRGAFLYLYLVVDVYSRHVMGWQVHEEESTEKYPSGGRHAEGA